MLIWSQLRVSRREKLAGKEADCHGAHDQSEGHARGHGAGNLPADLLLRACEAILERGTGAMMSRNPNAKERRATMACSDSSKGRIDLQRLIGHRQTL